MIDFRFHLVSLVAVLLALGVGILGGSFFVPEIVQKTLQGQIDYFTQRNADLREDIEGQQSELDANRRWVEELEESGHTEGCLTGRPVVVFHFDRTEESFTEGFEDSIVRAGGQLVGRVILSTRFLLSADDARAQLVDLTGSDSEAPEEVVADLATVLGQRMAAASEELRGDAGRLREAALEELGTVLEALESDGFITMDPDLSEQGIPAGAVFLIVGGSSDEAPWETGPFVTALGAGLGSREAGVVVAEPFDSRWGLTESVRSDGLAGGMVSTVDSADHAFGRIITVGALAEAARGSQRHYGVEPGAEAIVPQACPTD